MRLALYATIPLTLLKGRLSARLRPWRNIQEIQTKLAEGRSKELQKTPRRRSNAK